MLQPNYQAVDKIHLNDVGHLSGIGEKKVAVYSQKIYGEEWKTRYCRA